MNSAGREGVRVLVPSRAFFDDTNVQRPNQPPEYTRLDCYSLFIINEGFACQ